MYIRGKCNHEMLTHHEMLTYGSTSIQGFWVHVQLYRYEPAQTEDPDKDASANNESSEREKTMA
jgi:hypothetical protein